MKLTIFIKVATGPHSFSVKSTASGQAWHLMSWGQWWRVCSGVWMLGHSSGILTVQTEWWWGVLKVFGAPFWAGDTGYHTTAVLCGRVVIHLEGVIYNIYHWFLWLTLKVNLLLWLCFSVRLHVITVLECTLFFVFTVFKLDVHRLFKRSLTFLAVQMYNGCATWLWLWRWFSPPVIMSPQLLQVPSILLDK